MFCAMYPIVALYKFVHYFWVIWASPIEKKKAQPTLKWMYSVPGYILVNVYKSSPLQSYLQSGELNYRQ